MSILTRLRRLTARTYREAGPGDAADLVEGGAFLLDVREKSEFSAGHAPRAHNVRLSQLAGHLHTVPEDRTVVTVCRSGARSAHAARLLARRGDAMVNLAGGMPAWPTTGRPVVGRGRRPGRVA